MVEQSNIANSEDFRREYVQRQNQMDGLVGSHIDSQTKFCDTLRVSFLLNNILPIIDFLIEYLSCTLEALFTCFLFIYLD